MSAQREFRFLVRIYDRDVEGRMPLKIALTRILGIGRPMALRIIRAANMDPNMRVGFLTDEEIEKLVDIMTDPLKYGIPRRSLNRQRDPYTGEDKHMLSTDRFIQVRRDIENMIKMRSRKGIRHARGLKVRGQRTKTAAKRTDPRVSLVARKEEKKKKGKKRR